jgi:hypothetical protein
MRKTTLSIALAFIPGVVFAQQASTSGSAAVKAGASAQTKPAAASTTGSVDAKASVNEKRANGEAQAAEHANANAKTRANEHSAVVAGSSASGTSTSSVEIPSSFSAESRAKMEATVKAAREKNLPQQPMQQRVAEGQAKGASEVQIVAAVQKVEARMEATQSAMIRAGRTEPQPQEVQAGEQAMERGATDAQIEALVKHAPSDRSLVVAFDVLSKLEARGIPVDNALAQVQAKLDARASDDAIASLTAGVRGTGAGAVSVPAGKPDGAGRGASVAGSVTGAVTGVVGAPKKP